MQKFHKCTFFCILVNSHGFIKHMFYLFSIKHKKGLMYLIHTILHLWKHWFGNKAIQDEKWVQYRWKSVIQLRMDDIK